MRIPLRLVIDTNVVLDLFHFQRPSTLPLMHLIESGEALCFACPRVLEELRRVLPRAHFGLGEAGAEQVWGQYAARALCVADPPEWPELPQCRDTADQKFLQLAASLSADYLLTRDKALLRLARRVARLRPLGVMTPERFLLALGAPG